MRSTARPDSNISALVTLGALLSLGCVMLEGSTDGARRGDSAGGSALAPAAGSTGSSSGGRPAAGAPGGAGASTDAGGSGTSGSAGGSPGSAGTTAGGSPSAADGGLPIGTFGNTTCLNADGARTMDTYALIATVLGGEPIENPDLDHDPPMRHVWEDSDASVGDHFVFALHRDIDLDGANTDRQRVEIKTYDPSPNALKGFQDQTMAFSWRFQVNAEMGFSASFTHLFQLKAVDGDDDTPLITLSGATRDGDDRLEIRHSASSGQDVIADASWDGLRGQWLDVRVQVTFAESGALALSVSDAAGAEVLSVSRNLDLWRDGASYVRPKWGIYRSLLDKDQLRAGEETVRFANIAITSGPEPSSTCR